MANQFNANHGLLAQFSDPLVDQGRVGLRGGESEAVRGGGLLHLRRERDQAIQQVPIRGTFAGHFSGDLDQRFFAVTQKPTQRLGYRQALQSHQAIDFHFDQARADAARARFGRIGWRHHQNMLKPISAHPQLRHYP